MYNTGVMKKYCNIAIALWCMICLISCADDQGNYDYDWITSVQVTGFDGPYTFAVGDAMVLRPNLWFGKQVGDEIEYANEDLYKNDTYSYCWIAKRYDGSGISSDTIGRERNLNYIVNLVPNQYFVEYHAVNETRDITWSANFKLTVTLSAPEGWLLLEDNNGMAELSVYARKGDGTMHLIKNVLTTSGIPASAMPGPRQVFGTYQTQVGNGVWVMTDHFTGYLNVKEGHRWNSHQIVQNFMVESPGDDFVFTKMVGVMYWTTVGFAEDGVRVACWPGMMFTGDLLPMGKDRFQVAPYVGALGNEVQNKQLLFYDVTNKMFRILDLTGSYAWTASDEKFPKGYDMKLMEVVGETTVSRIRCLLTKDNAVYEVIASSTSQVEQTVHQISTSEKFVNAEQCVYQKYTQRPYYLYDSKLYVNRQPGDDQEVEYYRTPEGGEEVDPELNLVKTELEGKISYINSVVFSDLHMSENAYRKVFMNYLVVVTEMPDGTGKVYFLTPSLSNAQRLTISDVVDTEHKVVNVAYQRPDILKY